MQTMDWFCIQIVLITFQLGLFRNNTWMVVRQLNPVKETSVLILRCKESAFMIISKTVLVSLRCESSSHDVSGQTITDHI